MTDPSELAATLEAVADALDALEVRWAIGGSLASSVHGEPRATNDIDIIAQLSEHQARELAAKLGGDFYADGDVMGSAARTLGSFNVVDTRSFIKVDVFIPPVGPLGAGQLDRRRDAVVAGSRALPVLAAEDVVLQKLRWFSLGGGVSDRQWRDVLSVLRANARVLDRAYLEGVAESGGLEGLLAKAVADCA